MECIEIESERVFVLQAAQGAVRLEGDVITANGSIMSGHVGNEMAGYEAGDGSSVEDNGSVCSIGCGVCSCVPRCRGGSGVSAVHAAPAVPMSRARLRSTGLTHQFLPLQPVRLRQRSETDWPLTPQHRASI